MLAKDIKLLIAIVDDRVDDHFLIERALNSYPNIRFQSFYDGQQLIEHLEKNIAARKTADNPNIVLIDVNMPTISGYDTVQRLKSRSELNDIYFVIFSNSSEYDFLRHQDLGVDCYTKPPTLDKLKVLLEKIISDFVEKKPKS
jgi:CheY-like chemotaxis protein